MNPPVLEKTEEIDRTGLEKDPFPESGTDTFKEEWDTYLGTEEWGEYYEQKESEGKDGNFSTESDHRPEEDDHDYAYWIYERHGDSGSCNYYCNIYYEVTSPINVIYWMGSSDATLSNVMSVLTGEDDWTTSITEYTRYAWDREGTTGSGSFDSQHATAGTAWFGVDDRRYHVRCWEFGNYGISSAKPRPSQSLPNQAIE